MIPLFSSVRTLPFERWCKDKEKTKGKRKRNSYYAISTCFYWNLVLLPTIFIQMFCHNQKTKDDYYPPEIEPASP